MFYLLIYSLLGLIVNIVRLNILESRTEATAVRRSASTDVKLSVSETSPPSAKDSSPTQVLPSRRSSHTSSMRQQPATSPVQTTTKNSVDSKHGDVHSHSQIADVICKLYFHYC